MAQLGTLSGGYGADAAEVGCDMDEIFVTHEVTGEEVALPVGDWTLHEHASGRHYVADRETQKFQWCSSLLSHGVLEHPLQPKVYMVVGTDGSMTPLQGWRCQHKSVEVPIPLIDHRRAMRIRSFAFSVPWKGSSVFWGLRSLHSQVTPVGSCPPNEWYQNKWVWWSKKLSWWGWDASQLRKAVQRPSGQVGLGANLGLDVSPQCLPEASLSTAALVGLSVWWATPSPKGNKNEEDRSAWETFLRGLTKRFATCCPKTEWQCYADPKVQCSPCTGWKGQAPFQMSAKHGRANCSQISSQGPVALKRVLSQAKIGEDDMDLCDCLLSLSAQGVKAEWFLKQLCLHVGVSIERTATVYEDNDAAQGQTAEETHPQHVLNQLEGYVLDSH